FAPDGAASVVLGSRVAAHELRSRHSTGSAIHSAAGRSIMPVTVVCPACKARLKAPDNLLGKTVKCPGCTKPVVVKVAASTPPPAPAIKKPMKQPAPPVLEEEPLDDMEEELDEPKLKKNKKKRPVEEEEEPLDDMEEELDEPRPKKKKKKRAEEDYGDEEV